MFTKHRLFQGAVILTAAGLITRFMGFFFRIFLSHAFGEEKRRALSADLPGVCPLSLDQHRRAPDRGLPHDRGEGLPRKNRRGRERAAHRSLPHSYPVLRRGTADPAECRLYRRNIFRRPKMRRNAGHHLLRAPLRRHPQLHLRIQLRHAADQTPRTEPAH